MATQNRIKKGLSTVGAMAVEAVEYITAKAAVLTASVGEPDPIPKEWADRALKAHEYAITIDVVAKCVSTWRALVLGDGIRVLTPDETGRREINDFNRRIRLDPSVRDLFNTAIVRGEFLAYKVWNEDGTLKRIRSINPISVLPKYEDGELVGLSQYGVDANGKVSKSNPQPLTDLENYFHFRLNTPEWMPRGNSMILPAFELIEILKSYRKADKAIAKRWTTPLRFVKLGGETKRGVIKITSDDIDDAKEKMNTLDPNAAMVVPWHWDVKTYGTEGTALDTTDRIKLLCDQIAVAILLVPFLITGTGPTFATARVNLKALRFQIMDFVSMIKAFLDWLFDGEVLKSIGVPEDTRIDYQFSGLDVDAEQWERQLIVDLYKQNIVSKRSLQLLFNLDPDTEDRYISEEPVVMSRSWSPQDMIGMIGVGAISDELVRSKLGISEAEAKKVAAAASDAALQRIYAYVNEKVENERAQVDDDDDDDDQEDEDE